jgi:hypothetical protein
MFTDVSEVLAACIHALIMEMVRTFKTLENFYRSTRPYSPEDSHQHRLCYQN